MWPLMSSMCSFYPAARLAGSSMDPEVEEALAEADDVSDES